MITAFTLLIGASIGSVITAAWFSRVGRRKKSRVSVSHNGDLINLDEYEVKISE